MKDYLGICTGFAVSREAAARVHRATDGYPLLVRCVGTWLQSTPMGRRGIDQAIRHALEHEDLLHIRTQLAISLEGVGEPTGRVLDILAAAETPISERNLESILGERISPRELVQTGMVRWDDASCGYALRMRAAGRGLIGRLSCEERRDLHLALAAVLSGRESMHHQVAAAQLDPEAVEAESLHEQLVEAGREAAEAGDCGEAFKLVRLSARLRPDVEGLTRLGLLAVSADRRKDLVEFEPAVRALPASAGRSALLAMLSIQRADPQGALKELDRRTDLSGKSQDCFSTLRHCRMCADT
ncbi:hypothetical protein [Nesterenkonia pannonica]|uniref:hypothetical protein n=1 Tax=Nesterenkonia pannonica TaxID=1548602 RepID=UPI002164A3FA|nr:hypothetical protein [Nesterenkonia pannonica]